MSKIVLYWNLGSQPARAVKALLDISRQPFQTVVIDLLKGESRKPTFLAINPLGQIPFLKIDGNGIAQSNSILIYLCQSLKNIPAHYYGETALQRAKVNTMLSWYQNFYRPCLFTPILIKIYRGFKSKKTVYEYMLANAFANLENALSLLDRLIHSSRTDFLCGKQPSIADLLVYFQTTNIHYYSYNASPFKGVCKWMAQMEKIPEVDRITQEWRHTVPQFKKLYESGNCEINDQITFSELQVRFLGWRMWRIALQGF